jgi:hypothetical protein
MCPVDWFGPDDRDRTQTTGIKCVEIPGNTLTFNQVNIKSDRFSGTSSKGKQLHQAGGHTERKEPLTEMQLPGTML